MTPCTQIQQADPIFPELNVSDDEINEEIGEADYTPSVKLEGDVNSRSQQVLPESSCSFGNKSSWRYLYDSHGGKVPVDLHAKFTKAYLEDGAAEVPHHIMYRRNYFAVAVHYTLRPPAENVNDSLYVIDGNEKCVVKSISLRMRATKDREMGEEVALSVFTTKRGPPIFPTPLLEQRMAPNMRDHDDVYRVSTGHGLEVVEAPIHHTFSRLQFRKATDNNGVRRRGQSYYRVVIEMYASIAGPERRKYSVKIASIISGPLLVRGRCPNSFEPHDPTNRKRKPAKSRTKTHKQKGAKPQGITKNENRPKPQIRASDAAKLAASCHNRRLSSQTDPAYAADISSGSPTSTACNADQLLEYSPATTGPPTRLPPALRLPFLDPHYDRLPFPAIAVHPAQCSPVEVGGFENYDSGYGTAGDFTLSGVKNEYAARGGEHWSGYPVPTHNDYETIAPSRMQMHGGPRLSDPLQELCAYARGELDKDGQPTRHRREAM